ncbi:MAG TPA: hypothetical protein VFK74_09560 [Azospira sp.]|nr:hypothetical protein [Azospira sp.]
MDPKASLHQASEPRRCGICGQAIAVADCPDTVVCLACLDYRPANQTDICAYFCLRGKVGKTG